MGFTSFQNRMLLVDFPIYREFWNYNTFKPFDEDSTVFKEENLSKEAKSVFQIWSPEDSTIIPLMHLLKKNHIESWYMHGYDETFYSRNEKYNQFGFDSLLFIDQFKERNAKLCSYGFEGICDSSVINIIDSILYRPGDKFVYWTTLDSHPPYNGNLLLQSNSILCKDTVHSNNMCVYLSLVENTLTKIAQLAQKHPDYQFVIRGDHRPMATINADDFYYAWVPIIIIN
ncbi:MAG: hypothetical protein J6W51_04030 [Fibrobacter sp.]|nr:hypothetical protein [Fibrobacter sp.]